MEKMFSNAKNDADVMRIVQSLWSEYDNDANGVLDRREAPSS